MTRAEKMAKNKADKQIEKVYTQNCANITINMMDIPKVFKVGHEALAAGKDLKTAIVEFVEKIRTDKPSPVREESHAEYIERRDGVPEYVTE